MTSEIPGSFQSRHIGPNASERQAMLKTIGVASLDTLIDQTVPPAIRSRPPRGPPEGEPEHLYLRRLRSIPARNTVARSYIGLGYYGCVTPSVIQRNVFENPGWYTPYPRVQAEIARD